MDYREVKKLADEARELALKFLHAGKITKEEESQMITAAQATVFFWSKAGTPLQVARAHWLACRVLCHLHEAKLAYLHAQLCDFNTKKAGDRRDFDEAYAMEALARASALKGDLETGLRLKREAQDLAKRIRDPHDKEAFEKEFRSLSWFGLEAHP